MNSNLTVQKENTRLLKLTEEQSLKLESLEDQPRASRSKKTDSDVRQPRHFAAPGSPENGNRRQEDKSVDRKSKMRRNKTPLSRYFKNYKT